MYLHAIANTVPEAAYTQADCWEILERSHHLETLRPRSVQILQKILTSEQSSIQKRHFAMPDMEGIFDLDAEALNRGFEREAPKLSSIALRTALDRAGLHASELDALFVCTCSGYLCPGVSSYVAETVGLDPAAALQDLVGLGCGAAIPTLRSAANFIAANPEATVACIAVEICSAAFYIDDDPGVLISLCLFGDGASASIWRGRPKTEGDYRIQNFDTVHRPESRELLRFRNSGGKLRNQLHKTVPELAASAVRELWERSDQSTEAKIITHTGGRDVLDALATTLPCQNLPESRAVLADFGNMSSPSVLFALEHVLQQADSPEKLWLSAFGAGFAAHSCELVRG